MMRIGSKLATATVLLVVGTGTALGLSPEDRCEAAKLKEAGKYGFCRMKAEARAIKKGTTPDYSKCDSKFSDKWQKAETKAGPGVCPSEGDEADILSRVTADCDDLAVLLSGGTLPSCGNGTIDGSEQCDGVDLGGATCNSLVPILSGTLGCTAACQFDVSGCTVPGLPATGQTTSYGLGSDGDVQAGAPLSYTDNGDGTITDNNTGLMWEKKDNNNTGGIHDKDNTYTWCEDTSPTDNNCDTGGDPMDGTISSVFLDTLNDIGGGGANCFAGYCDWRIPNYKELISILNLETFSPAVDSAFHKVTCTGCTDTTLESCSCTALQSYWSSTTVDYSTGNAWLVDFVGGNVLANGKTFSFRVRAVRGGP